MLDAQRGAVNVALMGEDLQTFLCALAHFGYFKDFIESLKFQ